MNELYDVRVTVDRKQLLAKLIENRETHKKIVAEARAGYVEKAREALSKRLDELKSGKAVALVFALVVPVDKTSVYDTAIRMLELHQGDTIELGAQQVRNLEMDQWDWSEQFYGTNMRYSETANSVGASRGAL